MILVSQLNRQTLVYEFPYDLKLLEAVNSIPGVLWDKSLRTWRSPVNGLVARALLDEAKSECFELRDGTSELLKETLALEARRVVVADKAFALAPFRHQREAVERLLSRDRFLLADEMGLGKTKVACDLLRMRTVSRALILAPLSAHATWQSEWVRNEVEIDLARLCGSMKRRSLILSNAADRIALLSSYETARAECERLVGFIRESASCALILDECHAIKEPTSRRSKAAVEFAAATPLVWLLSGTPAPNSPLDLFVPLQLCGAFWRSKWEFENRYTVKRERFLGGGRRFKEIVAFKNEDDLKRAFDSVSLARKKAEVLSLPPKIRSTVRFDLGVGARKAYESMRKACLYAWSDLDRSAPFTKIASSVMEQMTRLYEICSGYLRSRAGKEERIERLGVEKLDCAKELVEDRAPTVFYARFLPTLSFAQERFPGLRLDGATPDRGNLIARFQGGEGESLLVSIGVAEGFTVTRAARAIFLERDWRPAVNVQAEDRLHRIGQTGTVNVYYLEARDTIEERMSEILKAKGEALRLTMGDVLDAI